VDAIKKSSDYIGVSGTAVKKIFGGKWKVSFGGALPDAQFEPKYLEMAQEDVWLLTRPGVVSLLQALPSCAADFQSYAGKLANAGLFQSKHLSFQEFLCAEAFKLGLLHHGASPRARSEEQRQGLEKWWRAGDSESNGNKVVAADLLNDEWYQNTFLLLDVDLELGSALFPQTIGSEFTIKFPAMSIRKSGLVPLMHIVGSLRDFVVHLDLPEANMDEFPGELLLLTQLKAPKQPGPWQQPCRTGKLLLFTSCDACVF
jgi:hypothetical protein